MGIKSFYNSSHNVTEFNNQRLKRAINDELINRDLLADDTKNWIPHFLTDINGNDFSLNDFSVDGKWHRLDMSQIFVDSNPKLVCFNVIFRATAAVTVIRFAPCFNNADPPVQNRHIRARTQVANQLNDMNFTLPFDKYKKILYNIGTNINYVGLIVCYWWE